MEPLTVLVMTLALPMIGAGVISLGSRSPDFARQSALVTSLLTLAGASWLCVSYLNTEEVVFAISNAPWISSGDLAITFELGLDGIGLWLFALSALLTVTCVLVSWTAITDRPAAFYALLLVLETGMLGVFIARDLLLFYVFFEFTLIPLFFLIGIWGSEDRRYAATKFFIYTLAGSLLTFVGLLSIVLWNYNASGELTLSIAQLTESLTAAAARGNGMPLSWQVPIFLALFAGFAIKVPLFPLHTWLPLAHVQAPTAGSVLLAGVLLKIGAYGFLRFSLPMLPEASAFLVPWMMGLSAVGIIYGALVALAQADMKKMIAYSSVSHLGFCLLGLFALNRLGIEGGTLQLINHGLSTAGLFAMVGMLYERFHTRKIADYGGLARQMPVFAFFFLLFTFSSIGLPGLNGFAGEFPLLTGAFQRAFASGEQNATLLKWCAVGAVFGVVLGAWYMLYLVRKTLFGPAGHVLRHDAQQARDMSGREILALSPLVVLMVWIGLAPESFLQPMRASLTTATQAAEVARNASTSANQAQQSEDQLAALAVLSTREETP